MVDRNDDNVSGMPDGTGRHVDSAGREGMVFTDEQLEAIAGLARENTYAKQSKWKTLRELPAKDKWPFFVQHFLGAIVAVVAVVAVVIVFVVNLVTSPPEPQLYIAGVNMAQEYTEAVESLEQRFVSEQGLDPELVTYDANFTIAEDGTGGGMVDGSSRLLTMATAGQVNTIITDEETFQKLSISGLVSPLDDVLPAEQVDALEAEGITIEADTGSLEGGETDAMGLSLDRSPVWEDSGLPEGTVLAFSNVSETGVEYPRAFVDFLDFS